VETIRKMYQHLNWANQRILECFHTIEGEHGLALRLFAHVLLAEQVWLARLQEKDSSQLSLWSDADLTDCSQFSLENNKKFTTLLAQLTTAELDNLKLYTNSKGQEFQTSIRDILTHVALHGQYHRGQINSLLRTEDINPVNIDYITFAREL
jgi:uncharacterized damage-inducible protein DinB